VLKFLSSGQHMPRARSIRPDVPAPLDDIIARALETDRKARYQTARALQSALEGWLRTQSDAPGSAELAIYMHGLFADRIAERSRVLEQSEISASRVRRAMATQSHGSHDVVKARRPRATLAAIVALVAAAAAFATISVIRRAPSESSVAKPEPTRLHVSSDPSGAEVQLDDVAKWHKTIWRPDQATFVVTGDVSADQISSLLTKAFASWQVPTTPAPKVLDPGPARQKLEIIGFDRGNRRLLQHDLREPDPVGLGIWTPPRQFAGIGAIPIQQSYRQFIGQPLFGHGTL